MKNATHEDRCMREVEKSEMKKKKQSWGGTIVRIPLLDAEAKFEKFVSFVLLDILIYYRSLSVDIVINQAYLGCWDEQRTTEFRATEAFATNANVIIAQLAILWPVAFLTAVVELSCLTGQWYFESSLYHKLFDLIDSTALIEYSRLNCLNNSQPRQRFLIRIFDLRKTWNANSFSRQT